MISGEKADEIRAPDVLHSILIRKSGILKLEEKFWDSGMLEFWN
jgi:hypothetical protein